MSSRDVMKVCEERFLEEEREGVFIARREAIPMPWEKEGIDLPVAGRLFVLALVGENRYWNLVDVSVCSRR